MPEGIRERRQLPLPRLNHTTPLPDGLPVAGGWGYSKEDACILTDDRESADGDEPIGLDFEFEFIEWRLIEELNVMSLEGVLEEVCWKVQTQSLERDQDGTPSFDCLRVVVTAYLRSDLEALENGENELSSGVVAAKRRSLRFMNECDFWFDVSRVKGIPDDAEFFMRIQHGRIHAANDQLD